MIKELREKLGLSQNKLAKRVGVSQSALSDIENGVTKHPRMDTMMKLAKELKVPVERIAEG